ncbi:NAD-dependent epimerase/dehydratase family protein [Shewanella subflava]|uniref:Nucleoside-diphosphate sugar epimerase n=1 Tax=Shewanella subflava TaxID=2986476 RepID=A0ABT3IB39_9GAMM|nr:NAD-dependent epimerase/dehydratase family protein [Shewanella subflava]MCW3173154.1 nucleoside-diphosphate sugar epimerase [Shewanella subflava]
MIAAIIGATGLVGKSLLELLLDSDLYQKVYVLGRSKPQLAAHHWGEEKLRYIACQLDELHEITLPETVDHAFCCLGTTIKQAGSQQAFIEVDKLGVLAFARLLHKQHHPKLVFQVISALDANPRSSVFYNRVKGEMEQQLTQLQLPHLQIFQPSLLIGKREDSRPAEQIGQWLFAFTSLFFIGPLLKFKPIHATDVAKAMYDYAQKEKPPLTIIDNKTLHQ